MDKKIVSEVMREMGRRGGKMGGKKGGKSRMESLTPEQRTELARQAGLSSGQARAAKAKAAAKKRPK